MSSIRSSTGAERQVEVSACRFGSLAPLVLAIARVVNAGDVFGQHHQRDQCACRLRNAVRPGQHTVVMVMQHRFGDEIGQVPAPGQEIADHRMIGAQLRILDIGEQAILGHVGLGQHRLGLRKTLDQQRNAAVVEQPEGIGDVRPHATQAFRQFGRHLGSLCRARPEALHRHILPTSQRHAQQVADDQAEHALRTEHIDRLHDGNRLVSRGKSRRIGDQHEVAGKGDILADQAGDFPQIGHVLPEFGIERNQDGGTRGNIHPVQHALQQLFFRDCVHVAFSCRSGLILADAC